MRVYLPLLLFFMSYNLLFGQGRSVSGKITDKSSGEGLIGVSVVQEGTNNGTISDEMGSYSLTLEEGSNRLEFTYLGYGIIKVQTPTNGVLNVMLTPEESLLNDVVVEVGSRAVQRTLTTTPLPIDNLTFNDLKSSGQSSFNEALQYKVPSFNSVNLAVQDATSLLDPYELRNLGPSRTLLLINGKRKN